MGGAGNVYNPDRGAAGRSCRLPGGGTRDPRVSGRVSPTGCPRLRSGSRLPGVPALRPILAHPLAAAAPGELTAGGRALLGAAVPCATSRGAGGGLRPRGPGSSAPSSRRKGRATTQRHLRGRVTSSQALPPLLPDIPPAVPITGPVP